MENIFGCDVPRSKGRKQGLINTRLIIYILGVLVLVEAGLFALCAGFSLLYEEPDYIYLYKPWVSILLLEEVWCWWANEPTT